MLTKYKIVSFYPYTILSIPFCPYHFVRYHFVRSPLRQYAERQLRIERGVPVTDPVRADCFRISSALKLVPRFEDSKMDLYLIAFQKCMLIHTFSKDCWTRLIHTQLTEKALKVYAELKVEILWILKFWRRPYCWLMIVCLNFIGSASHIVQAERRDLHEFCLQISTLVEILDGWRGSVWWCWTNARSCQTWAVRKLSPCRTT